METLQGKNSVLCGSSGVGKSSLINAVCPSVSLRTNAVSDRTLKGTHTTRHSEIIQISENTRIIDTPGFSKLDFSIMEASDIKEYFIEFGEYNCKFRGCLHDKEPGCAVKEAVLDGQVLKERYENYLKFLNTIKQTIKKY